MKNALVVAALAAVGLFFLPAPAQSADWKEYRSPQGDVTVNLPAQIKSSDNPQEAKDALKEGSEHYIASDADSMLVFSITPLEGETGDLDIQAKEVEKGLVKDTPKEEQDRTTFKIVGSPSGPGWNGRTVEKYLDGKLTNQLLLAIDQPSASEFAIFYTTDPLPPAQFDSIAKSLKMDEDAIKKKESARSARNWAEFTAIKSPADVFGLLLLIGGGLAYIAAGFWFVYVAFRTSIIWGVVTMFVPFGAIVFLCTHAGKATPPFVVHILGIIIAAGGMAMRHH